jgi:hypothetical protein
MPLHNRPYYTAQEVAHIVGVGPDTFHNRNKRERWHSRDKMPRPYMAHPLRFDKASIDAWRSKSHPAMPAQVPANDVAPVADTPDAARARLAAAYGQP